MQVVEVPRLGWLDGLRGVAAIQVVLLHYAGAFLPAIASMDRRAAHFSWEPAFIATPLGFLFDGSSAVYLFFIMSGVALTYAFRGRPFDFVSATTRRLVRLGLPMGAAVLLGAALFALLPDAHVAAAGHSGSHWLHDTGPRQISAAALSHQIGLEGLLAGSSGASLLPAWVITWVGLVPEGQTFNPPLWTLHIEFYGSLLVMLLVAIEASVSRQTHRVVCIVLIACFIRSPLGLFIAGHLAVRGLGGMEWRRWQIPIGAALAIVGICLCSASRLDAIATLAALLPAPPVGLPGDTLVLQKMFGALLIFAGIAVLPFLRRCLEHPGARWLGKISFSLYLTHFPLLFTGVAACFTVFAGSLPYDVCMEASGVIGITASLGIAALFERWIDRPSIRLSRIATKPRRPAVEPARAFEAA